MSYSSKGLLWEMTGGNRSGELPCNSGSSGLRREPAVDTEATLEMTLAQMLPLGLPAGRQLRAS